MQQTITESVQIYGLDHNFNPYEGTGAPFQLEIYHTKEQPKTNVGVLNNNTKKFSYKIGDVVEVAPKINVSSSIFLTNVVVNSFLQNHLKTK